MKLITGTGGQTNRWTGRQICVLGGCASKNKTKKHTHTTQHNTAPTTHHKQQNTHTTQNTQHNTAYRTQHSLHNTHNTAHTTFTKQQTQHNILKMEKITKSQNEPMPDTSLNRSICTN